ncbi:MAG TPA: ABC transporter permease [Terriglobia bacterium]|nr:ABC transporter permease [Terriglobia bacterium]
MSWRRHLAKLGALFRRSKPVGDLAGEIRAHLEMEEQENLESGMPPEEAHYAALRRFGNVVLTQERSREMWSWNSVETLWQDVRFGARMLAKNPGFTAVAVLTLGLGIGATTSIFSVVKAVILNPLPFREPQNLVHLWEGTAGERYHRGDQAYFSSVRPGYFYDWKTQSQSFESVSSYRWRSVLLTAEKRAELVPSHEVVDHFFETLGTSAQLGRTLGAADYDPGAAHVVVISNRIWVDRFGRDPRVIGRRISLDRESYEIVGVMPAGFYPTQFGYPELWTPHWADAKEKDDRTTWGWLVVARLKPGVTWERAQTELDVISARIAKDHPGEGEGSAVVVPMESQLIGSSWKLLLLLAGGVALLLLIACVNVANLILARVVDREREFAVRTALGAGRRQLIFQLFTESLALATAGAAVGILVASVGTRGLLALLPESALPRLDSVKIDLGVLAFVCGITLLTSLFFSLMPLLKASRTQPYEALKIEGRGLSMSKGKRRLGQAFVMSEFVLSLVLLILGALLVESFVRLQRVDPGFDSSHLLTFQVLVPSVNYGPFNWGDKNAPREKLYENLDRTLSAVPGVKSVGFAAHLPLQQEFNPSGVVIEGREPAPDRTGRVASDGSLGQTGVQYVNPNYFQTLGLKPLAGRFLEERDNADVPMAAVVNQTFARTFFPNEDPVGKRVTVWYGHATIVGVAPDFKMNSLDRKPYPEIFWSLRQATSPNVSIMARTKSDPALLSAALRQKIQEFDPDLPVVEMHPMGEVIADSLWLKRISAVLIGLVAGLAVILAGTGIYSVTAYSVGTRTREVGIRLALGADRRGVLGLILGETCRLAILGSVVGCAAAYVVGRVATSQVYLAPSVASSQIHGGELNPAAFAISSMFLFAVALSASLVPALRAMRVDPMVALRHE